MPSQTIQVVTAVNWFQSDMTAQLSSLGVGMTVTSLLGTFIIAFSMLPQTIMTLRIKQTSSLSLAFYTISGIACGFLTIYGFALCAVPWQGWNAGAIQTLDQVGSIGGQMTINYSVETFHLVPATQQIVDQYSSLGLKVGEPVYVPSGQVVKYTQSFNNLQGIMQIITNQSFYHHLGAGVQVGVTGGALADTAVITTSQAAAGTSAIMNSTSAQKAIVDILKSHNHGTEYSLAATAAAVIKAAGYNVAMGFTLPGAAVVFGEAFVTITSFMISGQKFANIRGAKKEGITEAEFEQKYYGKRIAAEKAKAHAKAHHE